MTNLAADFTRQGAAMASVREGGFFLGPVLVGGLGLDSTPSEEARRRGRASGVFMRVFI